MNVKKLIEKIEGLNKLYGEKFYVALDDVLDLAKQLDEPETGHADEAPRYLKNILARLRELPLHNREVWLKVIMSEFKQDFSHAKWREGYEQGKLEGMVEREKVKVKQFVADWITHSKNIGRSLFGAMTIFEENFEIKKWMQWAENQETFALAWIFGYEVEEEKRYCIVVKHTDRNCLKYDKYEQKWYFGIEEISSIVRKYHTRKQLEEANFGWVFDCEGIEIKEVE